MKRLLLFTFGFITLAATALAVVIYKWTFTPFGRLHPVMGVIHHVLNGVTNHGLFDRHNLPRVRGMMNLVKPRVPCEFVIDRTIEGPGGKIPLRIYLPEGTGPFPVVIYYHGGGFSIGSIDSHENVSRSIARAASSAVVSVGYRLAPEDPFPAAFDDAYTALQWAVDHSKEFNGDGTRLAVAGDSAGGNLAAAVSLKARDEGGPNIGLQILLYPTTILTNVELPSRVKFSGYILNEQSGENVLNYYLPNRSDRITPYASPLLASDHSHLPPAYIMTAAFDPLLDEGRLYAEKLEAAGVPVMYRNFEGMLHGFLSFEDLSSFFPPFSKLLKEPGQVYSEIAGSVQRWL